MMTEDIYKKTWELCERAWDTVKNEEEVSIKNRLMDSDGNEYNTVKIGEQYWTVENLKTTKYNNGSPITFINNRCDWSDADDARTPAYCFYDDDAKHGVLYNWYAVDTGKLAPKGWRGSTPLRVPNIKEVSNGE